MNDKEQKRIKKLLEVAVDGEKALLEHIFELEDKIDNIELQKGDIGDKGERGEKGEKGDRGDKGDKGDKGDTGLNGKDGKDGLNGKDGEDGLNGKDGKDGSPDTPEEIKKKLESLKDDARLDAFAIKNLPKFTREIVNERFNVGVPETPLKAGTKISITTDGSGARIISYTGTDGVSSVTNSDGTLTISPTTGAVIASLNLNNANTWTATQTFDRIKTNTVQAVGSGGLLFESNSGTDIALFGAGGGAGVTFYDGVILNSMTQGSVFFAGSGGLITQDNANFYWDDTNNQLQLGSATILEGSSVNPLVIGRSTNGYIALYLQNLSSGTAASTDLTIGNNLDNGDATTGAYADFGINSSGFTGTGIINGAGDAYLFNNLEDLKIGTMTAGKTIDFFTNGATGTAASKTRLTINDTGALFMDGTAANPSIAFAGSTTTGFYESSAGVLGVSIAGTSRGTWSASTLSVNSSTGATMDFGSTSQVLDFGGTVVPGSNTFQTVRTTTVWAPDGTARTNAFAFNNSLAIAPSSATTVTTLVANRSAIVIGSTATGNLTSTDAIAFEARQLVNNSATTPAITNEIGFLANNMTNSISTNKYGFKGEIASSTNRWNLNMSGTAQNYLEGSTGIGISVPTAKLHVLQSSLGTSVLKLVSTATNDDPTKDFAQGRVATTNATITTVQTIATTTDTTIQIKAEVIGRRTGGTGGTAGDGAGYFIVGTFKNIGGTVTQIGATTNVHVVENQAGWDCVFTISGTNVLVQITGATNNNVVWHCHADYKQVGT